MLSLISHHKRILLPLSAGLVLVFGLYIVASSFFHISGTDVADKELKSATREARSSRRYDSGSDAGEARSTGRQVKKGLLDTDADKSLGNNASQGSKKKTYSDDLVIMQKGARSKSKLTNQSLVIDETARLRAEVMEASYRIALKSENPWGNLLSVANEYHRTGEKVRAREILIKSLDMAFYPNDQKKTSYAVLTVFRAMLSLDEFNLAEKAFSNIPDNGNRQKAMVVSASWAAVKGRMQRSRRIIIGITGTSDRDAALVSLSASEAAYEGASRAMQTTLTISSSKKRNSAYQRIALARGELGDYSGAAQAIQQINDEKEAESTNVSLAKVRARAGDLHGTLGAIQHLKNPDVADASLKNLSQELASSGRFSNSDYVSKRIRGDDQRSQALESLSVAQAKSGDLSGSLSRVNAIPSEMIRNRSMIAISSITAHQFTSGQARNIATMIGSEVQRDRAYKAIAMAAAAAGDHTDAYNTIQQISRSDEKALALVSLARTRQKQGDSRASSNMLEDANRICQGVSSEKSLDKIFSDMAVAYAEMDDESSRSISLASAISSESQRDKTYQKLAENFAISDLDAAQLSILSISSDKTKTSAEDKFSKERAKLCIHEGNENEAINEARKLESSRQKIVFLLEVSKML